MRVAVLGAGRIGQVHARNIVANPRSTLAAVVDPVGDAASKLVAEYGGEVRSEDDVFEAADIDAILIGSPTNLHADQIERAAQAGKAILCEKPVDLSVDRVRRVAEVLEAHPVPLMVAFNRRFDPNFATLKSQIDAGAIGEVEMVTILSRDPGPPPVNYIKASGGLFRDMMIHDFDIAAFLVGEPFERVHAEGAVHVDPAIGEAGDVDTGLVTMRTASGKLITISNSRRATYGYDQRIEVHGSKGMLSAENVRESTVVLSTEDGIRLEKPMHFFLERYAAAYAREWDAFVGFVLDGTGPVPGLDEGMAALELADQASKQVLGA